MARKKRRPFPDRDRLKKKNPAAGMPLPPPSPWLVAAVEKVSKRDPVRIPARLERLAPSAVRASAVQAIEPGALARTIHAALPIPLGAYVRVRQVAGLGGSRRILITSEIENLRAWCDERDLKLLCD